METYGNRLMLIRSFFPPKLGSFGANMGPADPVFRPANMGVASRAAFRPRHCQVSPQLVYVDVGALYVSFLCQMGLFWMCNAGCNVLLFLLCLLRVFMLFPTCVPANQESPKLVEFVSNNSYHYC